MVGGGWVTKESGVKSTDETAGDAGGRVNKLLLLQDRQKFDLNLGETLIF